MYVLRNKETGVIVDPRIDETFAIDPADLGYETWDDVFSQIQETDVVDGFEIVDYEVPDDSILFVGKNYKIADYNGMYLLIGPVQDYLFDSFDELVEAHSACEEARQAVFSLTDPSVESVIPPAGDRVYAYDADKQEATIEIETAAGSAHVTAKMLVEGDGHGDWFINAMYVGHESIGGEPTDMEIAYALRAIETNDLGVS